MTKIQIVGGVIEILSSDLIVKHLLEFTRQELKYSPFHKKYINATISDKIYDSCRKQNSGSYLIKVGLGFAPYLATAIKGYISYEDYAKLLQCVLNDNPRSFPFPELRDYQNEDVLHLLKFKRGLFSCYTGYGKTQVQAILAKYFYDMGESVLLLAPGKKSLDEIVKRCNSIGMKTPSDDLRMNAMISSGVLNTNIVKDPKERDKFFAQLRSYSVVLCDEVEGIAPNKSGQLILDHLNAKMLYGFSGTSDKKAGELLSFSSGINSVIARNKDLVKYFGPTLVYRVPTKIGITMNHIFSGSLDRIKFTKEDFDKEKNVYIQVLNKMWTTPEVCEDLVKIIKMYPRIYIPINNLNFIISHWIDNYWIGVFRILLVCGEGYIYYDLNGNKTKLNLTEACEYIKNDKVDVIPSTSSGFRALDFPNLRHIFLISGNIASIVLQCIGRVARGEKMNIVTLEPESGKRIPVYTKGMEQRKELIEKYYRYCEIDDIDFHL